MKQIVTWLIIFTTTITTCLGGVPDSLRIVDSASINSLAIFQVRARVTMAHGEQIDVGRITAANADSLVLESDENGTQVIPFSKIARLEVSQGWETRFSKMMKGVFFGASVGLLAGIIQAIKCNKDNAEQDTFGEIDLGPGLCFVIVFGGVGAPLSLLFGLFGALTPADEKWVTVYPQD